MSGRSSERKSLSTSISKRAKPLILLFFIFTLVTLAVLVLTATVTIAVVQTTSMGSEMPAGSFVVYIKSGTYKQGDVIIFRVCGVLVTHRIVEVTPSGFSTKGDANSVLDSWTVSAGSVRGKLLFMVPHLGTIIFFLRSPLVFAALMTVAFAQASWGSVSSSKKQAKKQLAGGPSE